MKQIFLIIGFLFALAASAGAQSLCTIQGTLYKIDGSPAANARMRIASADVLGQIVEQSAVMVSADSSGNVSFTAIQGATLGLRGPFAGFPKTVTIPTTGGSCTAVLGSLPSLATAPTGIVLQDEGASLSTRIGTINFVGSGVSVTQPSAGVATVTISGGGGGGGSLTVKEADGTPAISNVDTVSVNQAVGLVITNPVSGEARIGLSGVPDSALATISTAGKIADSALSSNVTLLGNSTTGTGNIVRAGSPTLTTPTIASFTNAGHNHSNAAGGGTLGLNAFTSGALTGDGSKLATATGTLTASTCAQWDAAGNLTSTGSACGSGGGGSGTVTSFSAGNLSPLFTASVMNASSTPALSFTLSNAAAHTFFGNNTGSSAAPGFSAITAADLPDLSSIYQPLDSDVTALAGNSTNGFWARTGAGTGAARTLTGTANQITITNGNGSSGNPVFSLPQDYHTAATPQLGALGLGQAAGSQGLAITSSGDSVQALVVTHTQAVGSGADYAPLKLATAYTGVAMDPFDLVTLGITSNLTYGTSGISAQGTAHAFTSTVDIVKSNSANDEFAGYMGWMRFGTNSSPTTGSAWYGDFSLHGPVAMQPGMLNGLTMFVNNYFNGSPSRNASSTYWAITKPGQGAGREAGHGTSQTYPVDVGIGIVGWSGTSDTVTVTRGFNVGMRIGGAGSGWMTTSERSLIGTALEIRDVNSAGISLHDPRGTGITGINFPTRTGSDTWGWVVDLGALVAAEIDNGAIRLPGFNGTDGQISWGSDANAPNLYRSANDILRNSKSLVVDGFVGIGTSSPSSANAKLSVLSTVLISDPLFEAGSAGTNDSNSFRFFNGSGSISTFIAGGAGSFMPGTATGDGGIRVETNRNLFLGDSGQARLALLVGGFAQLPPVTFASLTTQGNGSFAHCSDCQVTNSSNNTCASGGNGAMAFKLNSVWRCFALQN